MSPPASPEQTAASNLPRGTPPGLRSRAAAAALASSAGRPRRLLLAGGPHGASARSTC